MPTRIFNTSYHKRMVRTAKAALSSSGWIVEHGEHFIFDFCGSHEKLILYFTCLDSLNMSYIQQLHQRMQAETGIIRSRTGRPLVWILDANLPGTELSELLEAGLIVFNITELCHITKAMQLFPTQGKLDPRIRAIMASSLNDCIRISELFEANGDFGSAVEWMQNGAAALNGFSVARVKLFELFLRLEKLDEADAVGREALVFRPDASGLVLAMEKLANRRRRPKEALEWREWYNSRCRDPQPVSFESISRSINQNLQSKTTAERGQKNSFRTHLIKMFFRRA